MNPISDLRVEIRRVKEIIAFCECEPSKTYIAFGLRALIARSEEAIKRHDYTEIAICMDQFREVKHAQR